MCDIPKPTDAGKNSECATPKDLEGMPMSLAEAAVALAENRKASVVLDWSKEAVESCGGNLPRKITFFDGFPDGHTACVNCGLIPSRFADNAAVCVEKCKDLVNQSGGPIPSEGVELYCAANARLSTNFGKDEICYDGACSSGGTPKDPFDDPRRHPEPVKWADPTGTIDTGNTLERDPASVPGGDFDAGAASAQLITTGDAWVEFEAGQNDVSHVLGVRESCGNVLICPDESTSLGTIGRAISLNNNNNVYVIESTPFQPEPFQVSEVLGTYAAGDRFRVRVKDNNDGTTATIFYTRLSCMPGGVCSETALAHQPATLKYPLRVDAVFREANASLVNVNIVRIK